MRWVCCVAAVCALASAGCEKVGRTSVKTVDEVIERRPKTQFAGQFAGEAKLAGNALHVRVEPVCALVEEETVETTTTYEKDALPGDDKLWMAAIGGVGTLPLGGGIALLADAPNVYDNDANGRTYNPNGQDSVLIGGVALTILGAAMVIPPVVNAFRYVGDEDESRTHTRPGATLKSGVACSGAVANASYQLTGRVPGQQVQLASGTGSRRFTVALKSVIPPHFLQLTPAPLSMGVFAGESFLGEVRIAEVMDELRRERAEQDERTWTEAEATACQSQRNEQACAGVRRYLTAFPTGAHAAEARALLARISGAPATTGQGGAAVVAQDPAIAKVEAAQRAAAEAAAKAQAEAEQRRLKEEEARAKKAAEDAARATKKACLDACAKACAGDADCKATCTKGACP